MSKTSKQRRNQRKKDWKTNKPTALQPRTRPPPIDPSQLRFKWTFARNLGPGLINMANTCFLNAVLCCLTYTAALGQYFLSNNHKGNCSINGFCGLCAMSEHVGKSFGTGKSLVSFGAIRPSYFTNNLKKISSSLVLGRQEDAHEFFMFLLDSFTKAYTPQNKKLNSAEEDSGLVNLIFGGKLRSQVTCTRCKAKSNSYDRYLDISLDIQGQSSIKSALSKFTEVDTIGADNTKKNGYNCESCKQKVVATKQMTVNELPKNLVIHLKRFEYDFHRDGMRKINKQVLYPERLNMAPYVSKDKKVHSAVYKLYAVLVHQGHSCNSGHYYAYVKNPNGNWQLMNDEYVQQVNESEVLAQKAYMLFYEQVNLVSDKESSNVVPAAASSATPSVSATKPTPSTVAKPVLPSAVNPVSSLVAKPALSSVPSAVLSGPKVVQAKSCMKRIRDDDKEPRRQKKVKFADSERIVLPTKKKNKKNRDRVLPQSKKKDRKRVVATEPESWVVRPVGAPYRSLSESRPPHTFFNAVGHKIKWTIGTL